LDRNGSGRPVLLRRGGLALLVAVLALNTPGTMSAQPDTDRSLNADKTATEPGAAATTNVAPDATPAATPPDQQPASATDTNAAPDLSALSRKQLEARVRMLEQNLASANAESESFRKQWEDLKLRDEALGVNALTDDQRALQDRLVQSVKELYQNEMKRREAVQLLQKLLDSTNNLLQTAPDYTPKVRAEYEVASRSAKEYLAGHSGAAIPIGDSLTDGRIADVNADLNSVVLNVGKTQGVKEGMPFLIYRDAEELATVRVVLARELFSAALIEKIKPNTELKIGDRAVVQTQ